MNHPCTLAGFQDELGRLVETFGKNFAAYQQAEYDETSLRNEFLNPLFEALGWDVSNRNGLAPHLREVRVEVRGHGTARQKRADYEFRIDRQEKFVCEAKRPHEQLHNRYIFQAKNYAWNRGLAMAVLTDFEEFKMYIVGGRPDLEKPEHGAYRSWRYTEYPLIAQEMWDLLSRDNIATGSIERLIESLPRTPLKGKARQQWLIKPDRTRGVDADFLRYLDEERRELASDIYRHNQKKAVEVGAQLNEAVQHILDRILFLRICEDRDIDTGRPLQRLLDDWLEAHPDSPLYAREKPLPFRVHDDDEAAKRRFAKPPSAPFYHVLVKHFRALDRRPPGLVPFFNGQLFKPHFSEDLEVGDEFLADFIRDLSDDDSPYFFNSIPVEILGSVYERFIGQVVRPKGVGITVEDKPEVRKAGGVYYTPRYIVNYIVEQTVGQLLKDKSPKEVAKLRILDPACGSGSFLIRAYERVMEHYVEWFLAHPDEQRPRFCYKDAAGDLRLTSPLKRQILTNNIFGVDIDTQAVEVTQLSLYLRMLQGETKQTMNAQKELFGNDPILPPLDKNIKQGNSLIASDFSIFAHDLERVVNFDWPVQFQQIMAAGGFDAVVGNPPYLLLQPQNIEKQTLDYFHTKYSVAQYKVDIYHLFIEQALRLVREHGLVSFITPAPFTTNNYTINLRKLILDQACIRQLVTIPDGVFAQASVDNAIFVFEKEGDNKRRDNATIEFAEARAGADKLQQVESRMINQKTFHDTPGLIFRPPKTKTFAPLEANLWRNSTPLGKLARVNFGMQLRDRRKFPQDVVETLKPKTLSSSYRRCLTGKDIDRYSTAFNHRYCFFNRKAQHGGCWDEEIQFAKNKVIVRQIGLQPIASLDADGLCCLNTVFMIKAVAPEYDEKFFLGLLNSKLITFYWQNKFYDFKKTFPKIKGSYLMQLPIPALDFSKSSDKAAHDDLARLVQKMLGLVPAFRKANDDAARRTLQNAVTATDRAIDQLVYKLYGLTDDEIKLVEQTPSSKSG